MIELPEARTISRELRKSILNKVTRDAVFDNSNHKFTFFGDDKDKYREYLLNKKVTDIIDRNFYIEIEVQDYKIIMRDGINIRYYSNGEVPSKYQGYIRFDDGSFLVMTTSMYGMIYVFKGELDNIYYQKELDGVSPLSKEFTYDYFKSLIDVNTLKMSTKAFLGTEQRFLGIGNGVLQDILFNSGLHPKRKMNTLTESDLNKLYTSIIDILNLMINMGGRDTESDIYGKRGGYKTILSKNGFKDPCIKCGGIKYKENYLGGSIYYCKECQK